MAESKKQYRARMRAEHGADWHKSAKPAKKARKPGWRDRAMEAADERDIAEAKVASIVAKLTAEERRKYDDRLGGLLMGKKWFDPWEPLKAAQRAMEERVIDAEFAAKQAARDKVRMRQLAEAREEDDRIGGGVWKDWPTRMTDPDGNVFYKQVRSADVMGYGYADSVDEQSWSECYFVIRSGKKYAISHGDARLVYVTGLTKAQALKWLRDEIAGKHEHGTYECDEDYAGGPWSPDAEEHYEASNPRRRRHNPRRRR